MRHSASPLKAAGPALMDHLTIDRTDPLWDQALLRKLAGVVSDGARGEVWRAVALQAWKSLEERGSQGEERLNQLKV